MLRGSSKPLARADADTIGRELRDGLEVADGQLVRRETNVRLPVPDVARHLEVRRHRETYDDIRELGAQVLDDLRHHRVSDRRDGTDREPSSHLLLQLRREVSDFLEADERLLDLRHKNNGFVGRLDTSPAFLEERKADDPLQVSNQSAHRRLGNSQRIGARADAAMQHPGSERLYHAVGDMSLCHSFAVDAERLRHCQHCHQEPRVHGRFWPITDHHITEPSDGNQPVPVGHHVAVTDAVTAVVRNFVA